MHCFSFSSELVKLSVKLYQCDIMIVKEYVYTFISSSRHRASKPTDFLSGAGESRAFSSYSKGATTVFPRCV